ncbi:translocator protein isoform X2 [Galleria mellonella]|nr:translocator protein isoform X2 [Galleria mellonella]
MTNWSALGSIILPNVGGFASGIYFAGQICKGQDKAWYDNLKKPSWIAPKYAFAPAWTVLYSSIGYASYLVWEECADEPERAIVPLSLYGGQLLLNWAWTPIFFGLKDLKLAFIEISVLSGAATATAISFAYVNRTAGLLLVPYLAWLGYATSLSYYVWKNNPQVKEIKDDEKTK